MLRIQKALGRLPKRFRWTLHNLVAHPVSELQYQLGLCFGKEDWGNWVHNATCPEDEKVEAPHIGPRP